MNTSTVYYSNIKENEIENFATTYTITRDYYNSLFAEKGNKDPQKAIQYLNSTEGMRGTIVELIIEG